MEERLPVDDLKDGSDAENKRADNQCPTPAKLGRDGPNDEAAKESACLENGNTVGVDLRLFFLRIPKVMLEGWEGENASHDAGVVGEKKRPHGTQCHEVDGAKGPEPFAHFCG